MATRFTLSGPRAGKQISITWDDGVLSGDTGAVQALHLMAQAADQQLVGLAGWWYTFTTAEHLASPYSCRKLMLRLFDDRRQVVQEGELPMLPGPPDGAIA